MERQVSYNSPLSAAPPPPINHPLPPKPPISMHFHAYTPHSLKPVTPICEMAAQYVNQGQTISVNNEPKGPSLRRHTTVSSVGVTSSLDMESVIRPFGADTSLRLENDDSGATGSINGDDFPHPDTLWSSVANSRVSSDGPRCADDGSCPDEASATASEDHGTGSWSCGSYTCDTDDVGQYDNDQTKHLTDGRKDGSSDTLGPDTLAASGLLVEESQPSLSGNENTHRVTEISICSTPQIPQPTFRSQKKPACIVSRDTEGAAPGGPRTRARARAEASLFSVRRRGRPFSAVEDALLRELVGRKLAWERIEQEFGRTFAERGLKSLQGRWSRKLKFLACPAKRTPDALGRRSSS
ncbi:Pc13g01050 [Penicillium rubens Wisconsin 54-1255]|uniref:Pc13g01050 protein n=1 Tax=Penicillium rubens (strain ATCC 28089 / DSM 1075 / NRRL 1951 / Wisconsin 54-1255) TaxID=500485 RepID=B6H1N2_PENRW|nr:Pc13g01050 [Penicillium rubens Wisconsin 54-1255]